MQEKKSLFVQWVVVPLGFVLWIAIIVSLAIMDYLAAPENTRFKRK